MTKELKLTKHNEGYVITTKEGNEVGYYTKEDLAINIPWFVRNWME